MSALGSLADRAMSPENPVALSICANGGHCQKQKDRLIAVSPNSNSVKSSAHCLDDWSLTLADATCEAKTEQSTTRTFHEAPIQNL